MRIFFRYELEHLMHRSVFPDYKIYGDFREQALDADSREFVVECFA
jgi:hypothetical protein